MNYNLDNTILYILILIIPIFAQIKLSSTYNKYKRVSNKKGKTGFEVARKILDENGLNDIYIVEVKGSLTDHYDPSRRVIRLSNEIYHGDSVAAIGVAAHECGHAIQDKEGYKPMKIRSLLVPLVNLSSYFSWVVIFIGLLTQYLQVFMLGIALISIGLVFQLITLPVEFDASNRARKELQRLSLTSTSDDDGVKSVLSAAAMTYVASVLTSILEIIRLILIFNNDRR